MLSTEVPRDGLQTVQLGLDAPAGRIDAIPSAVTGKPLRFATPAKLNELLRRCGSLPMLSDPTCSDPSLVIWMISLGAYRASKGVIDSEQARRLGEVAYRHASYRSYDDIVRLGRSIHPASTGLREEIVFSGSRDASSANHIYAPHEDLQGLVQDLANVLKSPPENVDPRVLPLVVGFYCSCIHPFKDGNGRWSRIMTMQAGVSAGSPVAGSLACVFTAMFYTELAGDIWPSTFSEGLGRYLRLAIQFENELIRSIEGADAFLAIREFQRVTQEYTCSQREHQKLLIHIFSCNSLDLQEIKKANGLSVRRMEGLASRIQEIRELHQDLDLMTDPALITPLWNMASKAKLKAEGDLE